MESTYQEALLENPNVKFYYVDLTNEMIHSTLVTSRNISKLPLLICYQNNKEINRVEGVANSEKITTFLKQ